MLGKKNLLLLPVLAALVIGCAPGGKKDQCATKDSCKKDSDCLCWCSQSCGFRQKTASDNPVYVENDENGKYCYCKQWDLDNYEDNCVLNKDVKQPKGSK